MEGAGGARPGDTLEIPEDIMTNRLRQFADPLATHAVVSLHHDKRSPGGADRPPGPAPLFPALLTDFRHEEPALEPVATALQHPSPVRHSPPQ